MEHGHPISAPGYPDNRSLFVLIPRQLKLKEKCGEMVNKKNVSHVGVIKNEVFSRMQGRGFENLQHSH